MEYSGQLTEFHIEGGQPPTPPCSPAGGKPPSEQGGENKRGGAEKGIFKNWDNSHECKLLIIYNLTENQS